MTSISLSDETYARVESRLEASDFESVDEYVNYVVLQVLNQLEGGEDGSAGDREEVMNKLRDLGYLE